jgi:hypothetical protein
MDATFRLTDGTSDYSTLQNCNQLILVDKTISLAKWKEFKLHDLIWYWDQPKLDMITA